MSENRIITIQGTGKAGIVPSAYPTLPTPEYMIVKVKAVAINPTDWKHIDAAEPMGCVGTTVGCDYAGEVVEVGSAVTKDFKKGDLIAGPVNGSNACRKTDGTFGEYITVKGDLQIKIPSNLSNEQAATLGIAVSTVGQSLYQTLKLPLPATPTPTGPSILIYGGATAMGLYGIQYAALSGATVYTVCSPNNFDLVRSLGAKHVFDYHDASNADKIREISNDDIQLAWDTVVNEDTAVFCAKALSSRGGKYSALLPGTNKKVKEVNPKVETAITIYYSSFGEKWCMFKEAEGSQEEYEFTKKFWELTRGLFEEGKLKPTPVDLNRGGSGLEGVLHGLDELRQNKVRATKLVYTL